MVFPLGASLLQSVANVTLQLTETSMWTAAVVIEGSCIGGVAHTVGFCWTILRAVVLRQVLNTGVTHIHVSPTSEWCAFIAFCVHVYMP